MLNVYPVDFQDVLSPMELKLVYSVHCKFWWGFEFECGRSGSSMNLLIEKDSGTFVLQKWGRWSLDIFTI